MKMMIITTVIFIPCLLLVNESDTILPNILGLCYFGLLFLLRKTALGEKFVSKLEKEVDKINDKLN